MGLPVTSVGMGGGGGMELCDVAFAAASCDGVAALGGGGGVGNVACSSGDGIKAVLPSLVSC